MTSNVTIVLLADDNTAKALVETIKSTVNGAGKYTAFIKAHPVTRANVADYANALAVLTYPNQKPVQRVDGKRTLYGNAVQAAGKGLRTALDPIKSTGADDLMALIIKAVDKGVTGNLNAADIADAVAAHCDALIS